MNIYYTDARCGDGKTMRALEEIATSPGRYVFVVDRRAVIETRKLSLAAMAQQAGTQPRIVTMTSTPDDDAQRAQSVTARISLYPSTLPLWDRHVILLITHEGMMQSDLSQYSGWEIVVDEAPNIFSLTTVMSPAMMGFFRENYTLAPISSQWSRVMPRRDRVVTLGALLRDETLISWAQWHKRVVSREGVITNLSDWRDVEEETRWTWWSLWSPRELAKFSKVTVLANALTESVTYGLIRHFWPEIEFLAAPSAPQRRWAPRSVEINYVAHHTAGSYFFSSPDGNRCLRAWGSHIARLYPEGCSTPHLWTSNLATRAQIATTPISGDNPTPRVAGSNQWIIFNHASICYSAKPSYHEAEILKSFGVDFTSVRRSREYEDIVQFALRTSLRDSESTRDVVINVYDRGQAEFLCDFLQRNYRFDARVNYVEIGLGDIVKPTRGRPKLKLTIEEREERYNRVLEDKRAARALKREATKAAKIAAGTYKPPGRPKSKG